MVNARYAIFFCPSRGSPLALFGERALGLSVSGERLSSGSAALHDPQAYPDIKRFLRNTQTPAHYGFHATLKAPFNLAKGSTESDLLQLAKQLVSVQSSCTLDSLVPEFFSGFMALRLSKPLPAVDQLAKNCVLHFDPLRAPLSEADWKKRPATTMSEQQLLYMQRYGYPYVLEEFRFHMTLTGKLCSTQMHTDYLDWLTRSYNALIIEAPRLDQLVVCYQPDRQTPFRRLAEFALLS